MHEKYLKFIYQNRYRQWYQPVILEPGIIEIQGKWNESTKDLSNRLLKNISDKSLLDVGCNTGFFLHEAHRRGASQTVGIDNDPEIVKLATDIARLLSIPVSLHNTEAIDFETNEIFDIALMLNILEFLSNPKQCVEKYLAISNTLIIEHEEQHKIYFPLTPNQTSRSNRAGGRIISIFGHSIDI